MKFYIVSGGCESGKEDGERVYYLIAETGECIGHWICSSKYFALKDLYQNNENNRKYCERLSNGNTEVLFIGEDDITNEELLKRNKDFCKSS